MISRTFPHPWVTVALAAALAGCQDTLPTGPAEAPAPSMSRVSALDVHGPDALPFELGSTAALLYQRLAPDFGPPLFGRSDFEGRCSEPADFVLALALTGEATHLGHFTGSVEHCTHIDFSTGQTHTSDGIMKLIAANGDELWATYFGEPGGAGVIEHVTFAGGTGRFASASGTGTGLPDCDQAAGTCVFELSGLIGF